MTPDLTMPQNTHVSGPEVRTVSPSGTPHLPTLDAMRGIAALSVCWFHYTNAQFTERFPVYQATGRYGYLGVELFFVISGFVIPWSLFRANYGIRSFFRFLAKRIIRLDPPYLCSILLVLLALTISARRPGHAPYPIPWGQVLAHLGYVNVFLGMPWLQMSYWTLAIEFQYYLFIGLVFSLISRRGLLWSALTYILISAIALLLGQRHEFLPHHLPIFLMGILAFRVRCLHISRADLCFGIAVATLLAWYIDGPFELTVGLASCATILFVNWSTAILNFFGKISYSLYLVHVFIGSVVYGLAVRRPGDLGIWKWILPWVAVALAIISASALYRLVELPSKRWSAKIRI